MQAEAAKAIADLIADVPVNPAETIVASDGEGDEGDDDTGTRSFQRGPHTR